METVHCGKPFFGYITDCQLTSKFIERLSPQIRKHQKSFATLLRQCMLLGTHNDVFRWIELVDAHRNNIEANYIRPLYYKLENSPLLHHILHPVESYTMPQNRTFKYTGYVSNLQFGLCNRVSYANQSRRIGKSHNGVSQIDTRLQCWTIRCYLLQWIVDDTSESRSCPESRQAVVKWEWKNLYNANDRNQAITFSEAGETAVQIRSNDWFWQCDLRRWPAWGI